MRMKGIVVKPNRRSLRECFRSILTRRDEPDRGRDDELVAMKLYGTSSFSLIPSLSSLSSFTDFGSSAFAIDNYSASTILPLTHSAGFQRFQYSELSLAETGRIDRQLPSQNLKSAYDVKGGTVMLARNCGARSQAELEPECFSQLSELVPASGAASGSESSFSHSLQIEPEILLLQSPLDKFVYSYHVPNIYRHGTSQQASLTTLEYTNSSVSTLRLQRSATSLHSTQQLDSGQPVSATSSIRPIPVRDADFESAQDSRDIDFAASVSEIGQASCNDRSTAEIDQQCPTEVKAGIASINHFASFCVLDAAVKGCPVTAISEDLEGVIDIGEEFCLDTSDLDGAGMDTVIGTDMQGNSIVHLVIYSPLINPNTGRNRFVIASLLDITAFITGTAFVPDLESTCTDSTAGDEVRTPPHARMSSVLLEQLIAECLPLYPDAQPQTPQQQSKVDIWLDIASEESQRSKTLRATPSTNPSPSRLSVSSIGTATSTTAILDQFIAALQNLYSDFFLLGKSPLDETSYEICNVSPRVHQAGDYVHGHISQTPAKERHRLEINLSGYDSFCTKVRWGLTGEQKRLYCVPLHGRSNITWACFLVAEEDWAELPLWD